MQQIGVSLKRDWYGNPEGKELWDLDADTMAKLVENGQAEYVHRDVVDVLAEPRFHDDLAESELKPPDLRRKR